jgi:hypothetical protein
MALFVLTLQLSSKGEGIQEQQVGLCFTRVALVQQFRPKSGKSKPEPM